MYIKHVHICILQLKQFQKSSKNSPKSRDTKAGKKSVVDSNNTNSKDTVQSDFIDTTIGSEVVADSVKVNSDSDNRYVTEPDITDSTDSTQVIEDLHKQVPPDTIQINQAPGGIVIPEGSQSGQAEQVDQSVSGQDLVSI